ncbi:hypothetical protein FJTKL_05140 [Diaporthe vaccinii]|uniref:Uncharacterized protein n=1 Tax=Diaporthe vaccinii TaxID=105482 RepID=A0ABR4FEM9_9PEZI
MSWPGHGTGSPPRQLNPSHPKSTQLRPAFKEANNLPHPNYLTPGKLHHQPRGLKQSTSSTSNATIRGLLTFESTSTIRSTGPTVPLLAPCDNDCVPSLVHHDRRH